MVIVLINEPGSGTELVFDFVFEEFVVSENEDSIYLISNNQLWIYSLPQMQLLGQHALQEEARIAQLFDKQQLFLSYDYDDNKKLTCWSFGL